MQLCPSSSALVFGIATILIGMFSKAITKPFLEVQLPEVCQSWNDNHVFEASLFLTGFITYFMYSFAKSRVEVFNAEWSVKQASIIGLYFGIAISVVSYVAKAMVYPWLKVNLPDSCKGWNDKYIMEISRFITGWILGFAVFTATKKADINFQSVF